MRASDRVYQRLRGEILDGVLPQAAVLGEVEQAERLGVSRTPVREALARLSADGLVSSPLGSSPSGRGLVVTELSVRGVTELYELRLALEEQAARLAATRGDPRVFAALAERFREAPTLLNLGEEGLSRYYELSDDFDAAVDDAVANPYLTTALGSVRTHLARIRRLARHDPERLRAAASEHLLIVEAIAAGDAHLAGHATHIHLHNSRSHIVASVERHLESASAG